MDTVLRDPEPGEIDPFGSDLQLALTVCYELHYRGFAGVDPEWEWRPDLLRLRSGMERTLLSALHLGIAPVDPATTVADELARLSAKPVHGSGASHRLRECGTWAQMREYFAHRSIYHLKEGDPHPWLIPRLSGPAKASFVAVEFDEFGAGWAHRAHHRLFVALMGAADLDARHLGYLDAVATPSLLVVNLMSLFGLHRRLRGAAAGQFAAIEITSSPGSRRMVDALRRLAAPAACVHFYAEHVEADAVTGSGSPPARACSTGDCGPGPIASSAMVAPWPSPSTAVSALCPTPEPAA
ncbi:MAG: iron-containing redox enzyme family protein [Mycobacterium sp.]|nr:iron-containing redox enzyme family protein [Mycobacterium sp.]